jgi:hypothetical protein
VLRDGTLGYFQRRTDDCVQASIASLIQMPMYEVPDLQIDKHIAEGRDDEALERSVGHQFSQWMEKHSLTMYRHVNPPLLAKRWIGVVSTGNEVNDHCLVMTGHDCVWDTSHMLPPGKHEPIAAHDIFTPRDINYGITIERR